MKTYSFKLVLKPGPDLTDDILDAIFEAGGDDSSPAMVDSIIELPFDREAPSLEEAISSAVKQIESIPLPIDRVEMEREFDLSWIPSETLAASAG